MMEIMTFIVILWQFYDSEFVWKTFYNVME